MTDDDVTAAVKRKLNITWSDYATDGRVSDVIRSAGATVRRLCDIPSTTKWETDTDEGAEDFALFLDACLYDWSNALDDFRVNYADAIMADRLRHQANDTTAATSDA